MPRFESAPIPTVGVGKYPNAFIGSFYIIFNMPHMGSRTSTVISEADLRRVLSFVEADLDILAKYDGRLTAPEVRIQGLLKVIRSEFEEKLWDARGTSGPALNQAFGSSPSAI
jgi:hypothetical protein